MYLVPMTESTLQSHTDSIIVLQCLQKILISSFCICFVIRPENGLSVRLNKREFCYIIVKQILNYLTIEIFF